MAHYWSLFTPAELNDVCSTWHNVLVYDISKHQVVAVRSYLHVYYPCNVGGAVLGAHLC